MQCCCAPTHAAKNSDVSIICVARYEVARRGTCRLNPQPYTLNPAPYTLNPKPYTLNPKSLNPKPYTLNPKPKPYGHSPDP